MTDHDAIGSGDDAADRHRKLAIAANNATWELLDGRALDAAGADELLQRAYASAYHWRRAVGSTAVNETRASWLLSRANAVLGHGELALHHAQRCFDHLDAAADAADFDHAYAHEAKARALACLGRSNEAQAERNHAAAVEIANDQDREIFEGDLAAEPWFDLEL